MSTSKKRARTAVILISRSGSFNGRRDSTLHHRPRKGKALAKGVDRRFLEEWWINAATRAAPVKVTASAFADAYYVAYKRAGGFAGFANRHARKAAAETASRAARTAYQAVIGSRYRVLAEKVNVPDLPVKEKSNGEVQPLEVSHAQTTLPTRGD